MQGKSRLNANAAPFVPRSQLQSANNNVSKKIVVPLEKNEDGGRAAAYELPDTASFEKSLENLHISEKPFSDMGHSFYSGRKNYDDETSPTDDFSSMSFNANFMVEFLLSRFPDYSAESLSDFLKMNNGDLEDTIDHLEQLEEFAPEEVPEAFGRNYSTEPSSSR